jgi:hypothetical protein
VKVRNGPEPKPLLLERDEYFLHHVTEEDMLCPPGKVREILASLGGKVEGQDKLKDAIMREIKCSEKSARTYIAAAVSYKTIKCNIDPENRKQKVYEL